MPCSSADVQGLSPANLVAFLETHTYECVYEVVWTFDANLATVLSTAHLTAVVARLQTLAPAYQGTDAQHVGELLEFTHAAYFHKFYNAQNQALFDTAAVAPAASAALDAFIANPDATDLNPVAGEILYDWLGAVDGAFIADRYFAELRSMVQAFVLDPQRQADSWQRIDVWIICTMIQRAVGTPAFDAKMDQAMITALRDLALLQNLLPANTFVVNAATYTLGVICSLPAWKASIVAALTDIKNAYPPLSEPYLWAISALGCNNCIDANAQKLCKSDVVPQLEAQLFPNTWTFDDGAIVVRTPLALADIQPVYHAMKVVQAQFNRLTETIAPLTGDPNGVLTIKLYGTKADYAAYQTWLYGLPTANGGIYIEDTGTFYTYQRTPQESIYSLEELTRHEYNHYLVGRFLIAGIWGQAPIYAMERLTWVDEGLAEFLTWSTPHEGIRVRRRLVELVAADGQNGHMTVSQIVSAKYGDFKFYRYACLLFAYWYEHDLAALRAVLALVRAGDVPGFDALIASLTADVALQAAYENFLNGLVANVGNLDNPQTTFPPPNALDEQNASNIATLVRATRLGYLAEGSVAAASVNARFSCRGYLSGQLAQQADVVAAWREFDAGLDEIIAQLEPGPPNNFAGLVGRFGRIRFVDYNAQVYAQADYFLDGPLAQGQNALLPALAQVTADFNATRLGKNPACTLVNQTLVQAKVTLTTRARPNAVPNTVLDAEIAGELDELRNQVYAIRPAYYRDLECTFDGPGQVLAYNQNEKYMLRPVVCLVHLA